MDTKDTKNANDDPHRVLWGAKAFAEVLNTDVQAINYLISKGRLDVSRNGSKLVSTPYRLRHSAGAEKVLA